ncbi:MAG: hypothetical protein ACE5JR_03660 [Gemmatimonadota bacterium]
MRYVVFTELSPEEVLERAKRFFSEHSHLTVQEETACSIVFSGEMGSARLRVDREGGHTNVHAVTDRVVGLDVTDLTKRFLYTLGHVTATSGAHERRAGMGFAEGGASSEIGPDAAIGGTVTVRLAMPDRWLEQVEELPLRITVEEAKRRGLRAMLLRTTDDPDDFYVEYAEQRIPDESITLEELGMRPREILSIRAYDLGHYRRFRG